MLCGNWVHLVHLIRWDLGPPETGSGPPEVRTQAGREATQAPTQGRTHTRSHAHKVAARGPRSAVLTLR